MENGGTAAVSQYLEAKLLRKTVAQRANSFCRQAHPEEAPRIQQEMSSISLLSGGKAKPPTRREQLAALFKAFDFDDSGAIDAAEIYYLRRNENGELGAWTEGGRNEGLLAKLDADKNGMVDEEVPPPSSPHSSR